MTLTGPPSGAQPAARVCRPTLPKDHALTLAERGLLHLIEDIAAASPTATVAVVPQTELATLAGLSRRGVQRHLAGLHAAGFLEREHRPFEGLRLVVRYPTVS